MASSSDSTSSDYDMRFDRHRCKVPHESFSLKKHTNLFINLDDLPADAPMMRFDARFTKPTNTNEGVCIPLIIAGPLYALSELHLDEPNESQFSFIGQLDGCSYRGPQPYSATCTVCRAVKKIVTECKNYADCKEALKGLKPLHVYQVAHEIWCRLWPIPLVIQAVNECRFENFVYSHITRFDDIAMPNKEKTTPPKFKTWNERRDIMLEWTNGYAFITRSLIEGSGTKEGDKNRMQRIAAGFILAFMLRFLRGYTTQLAPELTTDPNSPYFLIDAIKALYEEEINTIDAVVLHLYPVLLRTPSQEQTDDNVKKVLKNVMRTILTMNVQEAFMPELDIERYYVHNDACPLNREVCFCRWARYLEENLLNPILEPTIEAKQCAVPRPTPIQHLPVGPITFRRGCPAVYYGNWR